MVLIFTKSNFLSSLTKLGKISKIQSEEEWDKLGREGDYFFTRINEKFKNSTHATPRLQNEKLPNHKPQGIITVLEFSSEKSQDVT